MPDIQHLIELLKSDNPNKRCEACEELRVSQQPLPQEAIDALQFATRDSNLDVADAARRAIGLHTQVSNPAKETHLPSNLKKPSNKLAQPMKVGMLGAFVGAFPISILKLIIDFNGLCTSLTDLGDDFALNTCGLLTYYPSGNLVDTFLFWIYLGFILLGGAIFGILGARIRQGFVSYDKDEQRGAFGWSFTAGLVFDVMFVYCFLWPGF